MRVTAIVSLTLGAACFLCQAAHATHPVQDPPLETILSGQNEVSNTGQLGVGDPDATGTFTAFEDHGVLVYDIAYQNVSGETISGLHIHGPGATSTANSPIFLDLLAHLRDPQPALTLPNGSFRGVIAEIDLTDEVRRVFENPSEFYVNLHTSGVGGFPSGAIRGMLPEPSMAGVLLLLSACARRRRQAKPA